MENRKEKWLVRSMQGKIVTVLLIALFCVAVLWCITKITFGKMVATVEIISRPNEQLHIINDLSQRINQISWLEQKHILQNSRRSYATLLPQSGRLMKDLDTLALNNTGPQLQRIDSMRTILYKYDSFLIRYLKLYAGALNNKNLSRKIHLLSDLVTANALMKDSSVTTAEKKTTTITTTDTVPYSPPKENEKLPFLKRLFSRKRTVPDQVKPVTHNTVKEELNIHIDTLVVAQQDSLVNAMGQSVEDIENYQQLKTNELAGGQQVFLQYENALIDKLQGLLQDINEEELVNIKANNRALVDAVNGSIDRTVLIMILFFVIMIILASLIFADVSRSNRYRRQLLLAKEEAEYLGAVKQRFLSNMSHEIRTPLQSIVGFSEQMMQQEHLSAEAKEAVYHSSLHLLQIVNEVLDYSRIVSGKFLLEEYPFDMLYLLNEIATTMRLQALKKNIKLELVTNIPAGNNYAGDPFRLKQILYNIVGNAIKFTEKGTVTLSAYAVEDNNETLFRFEVKDTGIGIAAADLERIFIEFEQADPAHHKTSGTGLGLTIVKSLIEQQEGTIEVESVLNEGTVFSLKLVYKKTAIIEATNIKAHTGEGEIEGKVLLIDDDPFILKLYATILNKYPISFSSYRLPGDLLNDPWDEAITSVLVDIRMPGIDGIELYHYLRNKIRKDGRIIAVTAQSTSEERALLLQHGFNAVVTKPFMERDILTVLHVPKLPEDDFQHSDLIKMSMGDAGLLEKNISSFIKETLHDLNLFRHAVEELDRNEVLEIAHRLAGRLGQFGAHQLSFRLRFVETYLLQKNELLVIKKIIDTVIKDISNLVVQLGRETVWPEDQ